MVIWSTGCAFSRSEEGAGTFDQAVYTGNPNVRYPTGAGNVVGAIVSLPLYLPAAVAEDVLRDDDRHPVARVVLASTAYAVGAATGSPFVAIYYGLLEDLREFFTGVTAEEEEEVDPDRPEGEPPDSTGKEAVEWETDPGEQGRIEGE